MYIIYIYIHPLTFPHSLLRTRGRVEGYKVKGEGRIFPFLQKPSNPTREHPPPPNPETLNTPCSRTSEHVNDLEPLDTAARRHLDRQTLGPGPPTQTPEFTILV